jgi:hypothetical protein
LGSLGSSGNRSSGICSLGHLQPEQRRNITVVKHLRCSGRCFAQSNILSGNGEQFIFIHTSQHEEKLGLFVEPGATKAFVRGGYVSETAVGQAGFRGMDE